MKLRTINQRKIFFKKRVLVRVDFNVPLKSGRVIDDFKIRKSLHTIKYLLTRGAQVILISHLGRPSGVDKKLSLKPVASALEKIIGKKVNFCDLMEKEKIGDAPITLLENIRFVKGEEENTRAVAKQLASLADVFVLDGFAVAHRNSASVTGVAKFLPTYAGLLLADEIAGLTRIISQPKKPLVIVLGGVKMDTKIPVLKNLLPKASHILVGGGIANTYWWASGRSVGASLIDKKYKKEALLYGNNDKVVLPVDVVVGQTNGRDAQTVDVNLNFKLKNSKLSILDIGPRTVQLFARYLKKANTIVWNGALGYFEQPPYQHGTYALARLIAGRAKGKAFGVCGGGETVEILQKLDLLNDIDLVSTGGGAMLEFLSGKNLPGIQVVKKFSIF